MDLHLLKLDSYAQTLSILVSLVRVHRMAKFSGKGYGGVWTI